MQIRKWKKFRLSKYRYPTRVVIDSQKSGKYKGHLVVGRDVARAALKAMLGRSVDHMKSTDSRGEWIFMEPLPSRRSA